MARLNFVLPSFPMKPGGGVKNMYEFANRLSAKGHQVTVIHSIKRPYKKQRTPVWLRLAIVKWRAPKMSWFKLAPSISVRIVREISDRYIPDAEATISTWWQMAYAINTLSESKGRKINLIQDYELWTGQEDKVHDSYSLPVQHLVIARYLQEIVKKFSGRIPELVNTPIDTKRFTLSRPIEDRDPNSVMMMYSEEPRKGSAYGIEAFLKLKTEIPDLKLTLFSVFDPPANLPGWIVFHKRPDNLPELYNRHAIFFSPSLGEGWALPPAESMACGCAVVCTNIGGHHDYAIDNETALLVEPKNPTDMAQKVRQLIDDQPLRLRLARTANQMIGTEFTWEKAVNRMETLALR